MKTRPPNTVRHIDYRVLSILMAITILFGAFPLQAFAETDPAHAATIPDPLRVRELELGASLGHSASLASLPGAVTDEEGLRAAFTNGVNGSTITLGSDITLTSAISIANSKTFILDGAGFTIYQTENVRHFTAGDRTKITIVNLTLDGNKHGGGISVGVNSALSMEDSVIRNCGYNIKGSTYFNGGAIESRGSIALNRVTLTNNQALEGGAVYAIASNGLTFEMSDCIVSENNAWREPENYNQNSGGAILLTRYTATISDTEIVGNSANYNGGGIYMNDCQMVMERCLIADNSAMSGAGLTLYGQTAGNYYELYDVEVTRNTASQVAAGIYASGFDDRSYLLLENVQITHNVAATSGSTWYGGGIFLSSIRTTLESCTIEQNQAGKGGGIYLTGCEMTVRNSGFYNNKAVTQGGAIGIQGYSQVVRIFFESGELIGNTASQGGAIWVGDRNDFGQSAFIVDKSYHKASIGADVVFRDNKASMSYALLPEHQGYHETWVQATAFSNGHKFAYNNDDIVYPLFRERTIRFDTGDGTPVADLVVRYGNVGQAPSIPTHADATFGGWFRDAALTMPWSFDIDKMPDEDITLYARWLFTPDTATFMDGEAVVDTKEALRGERIPKPEVPAKPGHRFTGWYTGLSGGALWSFEEDTMPQGGITLYARWVPASYTVMFDTDGGRAVPPVEADYGQLIPEPEAPAKPGHTFRGWFSDAALTVPWDFSEDTVPADGLTLFAAWEINTYTVTFDTGGMASIGPQDVKFGALLPEPAVPEVPDHSFVGWFRDAELTMPWDFSEDTMPVDGLTLYGAWEADEPENPEVPGPDGGKDPNPGDGGGEDPSPGDGGGGGEDPGPGDGGGENPGPGNGEDPGHGDEENPDEEEGNGGDGSSNDNTGGSSGGTTSGRDRDKGTRRRDKDPHTSWTAPEEEQAPQEATIQPEDDDMSENPYFNPDTGGFPESNPDTGDNPKTLLAALLAALAAIIGGCVLLLWREDNRKGSADNGR